MRFGLLCCVAAAAAKPLDDKTIREAVTSWFEDRAAAEAKYGHIKDWDTSGVTDMSELFCRARGYCEYYNTAAKSFNEDISGWDTSGVTAMNDMFYDAKSFNQPIGNWRVDKVKSMSDMFSYARSFNQPLNDWRVDKVNDMSGMFHEASSFNQQLSGWQVDKVTTMEYMFYEASAFDQDLGWCVGDDVDMNDAFYSTKCGDIWATKTCGVLPTAASSCGGTAMGDGSIRVALKAWFKDSSATEAKYGKIKDWDTSGVTDMSELFCAEYCGSNTNWRAAFFNEDISGWDTSGVTTMAWMFEDASAFNRDIGGWDTSGVKEMTAMFYEASRFNQPIGGWKVDQVTDMSSMFEDASAFNQPLGDWRLDKVTNMEEMFESASAFNQDLGWCVADDVDITDMFDGGIWGDDTPACASTSCGVEVAPCTVAEAYRPTYQPTYKPSLRGGNDDDCTDDADWSYVTKEGDEYGCDHVARKPEKRCGRVGNGGVVASEACPETCGNC